MNNLGGTTPWALALSTVLLATSVVAQEFGRAPEGKKKAESPSLASVDDSIVLGCFTNDWVTCCLGDECVLVAPDFGDAKEKCYKAGGNFLGYVSSTRDEGSYNDQKGNPVLPGDIVIEDDFPSSFDSCSTVDEWGGCGLVSCCFPGFGGVIEVTAAQCNATGGQADLFGGSCPNNQWMNRYITGICFSEEDGRCLDSEITEFECSNTLGGQFLGFPRYEQLIDREVVDPVNAPFQSNNDLYPGRQWIEPSLGGGADACLNCDGGQVPLGQNSGTWVVRRGFFSIPEIPSEPASFQVVSLPKWSPPADYIVTGVRVRIEGGNVLKQGASATADACSPFDISVRQRLEIKASDELNLPNTLLLDRFEVDTERVEPNERLAGANPVGSQSYAPFFDWEYFANTSPVDEGASPIDWDSPFGDGGSTDPRPMVAIGIDLPNSDPAAEDGSIEWDSNLPGDFGLDISDWVGSGNIDLTFDSIGEVQVNTAPSNSSLYFQLYTNIMVTVCYDYERVVKPEACECPEGEDLHLREAMASVLALPKVDLRWAYVGPSSPTQADLKNAENYELEQDTIFQLTNDFAQDVRLQVLMVNGDGPINGVDESGTANDFRSHHGWNQEIFDVVLTGNQPQVASFAEGGAWSDGANPVTFDPFTVLDSVDTGSDADEAPGRPASDMHPFQPNPHPSNPFAGPYDRELRGFAYVIAVESTGTFPREINWNHLDGVVTVINYADTAAWTYRPVGLRALNGANGAVLEGAVSGTNGMVKFDDEMYAKPACEAVFGFQAQGSGSFGSPELAVMYETSLELVTMPVVGDFRPSGSGQDPLEGTPFVEMQTRVWNENEIKFEENIPFQCWNQYSDVFIPDVYTSSLLETDMGKARICAANAGINYLDPDSEFGLEMLTFPLFTTRAHHLVFGSGDIRPTSSAGVTGRHVGRLEGRIRYAR